MRRIITFKFGESYGDYESGKGERRPGKGSLRRQQKPGDSEVEMSA